MSISTGHYYLIKETTKLVSFQTLRVCPVDTFINTAEY